MKIAVQFFGHLRDFEKCFPTVRLHLLSKYDCDVFMHTWDETEHHAPSDHRLNAPVRKVDRTLENRLQTLYQPKALLIEHQNPEDFPPLNIPLLAASKPTLDSLIGIRYMIRSEAKVNQLRQTYQQTHNINYDYVIMLRPDVWFKKDFILSEIQTELSALSETFVRYATAYTDTPNCHLVGDLVSDALFMATPTVMDKIIRICSAIEYTTPDFKIWNPELLILDTLQHHHIPTVFLNFPFPSAWELHRARPERRSFSHLFRLKLKKNLCRLHILSDLSYPVIESRCLLFNYYQIEFCIGAKLSGITSD